METPASGTMGSSLEPHEGSASRAPKRASLDRSVRMLLSEELIPFLRRRKQLALADAVDGIVEGERGGRLERLPGRLRTELLESVERWIVESERPPDPRAIVRLVTAVVPLPTVEESLGRWRNSPGR